VVKRIEETAPRQMKTTLAQPPTIYLIAGCNGAGKTTFAKEFLPKEVKCLRFLNAGAAHAARLLLTEIRRATEARQTFGLETTLSGLTYVRMLINARERPTP
jgi:predicted ABC-type ATPase